MDVGGNSNNYTQDPSSLKKGRKLVSVSLRQPVFTIFIFRIVSCMFGSLHVHQAWLLPLP